MPHTHPLFSPPLRGFRALSAVLDDASALWDDLEASARSHWIELTTRTETDTAYVHTIVMPGFKRDQVCVEVQESYLTVAAKGARVGGPFSRTITLPTDADPTKVEAKLEDGILSIVVSKVAKPTPPAPRKVTVS